MALFHSVIIAIEKPCQHDILRTALARIMIVGIQVKSEFHEILTELYPFSTAIITIEKPCQHDILGNA